MIELLRCQQCAAGLHPAPGQTLTRCTFCGSTYLLKSTPAAPTDAPVRWLPFAIDAATARTAFARWLSSGFFAPGDLASASASSEPAPVLVPLYLGRARAHSNWSAEVVRSRVKKVNVVIPPGGERKTGDNVRMRSDSHFVSGAHDHQYENVFVLASSGLIADAIFDRVADYDLGRLEPMPAPDVLAHTVEAPQASLFDAAAKLRDRIEALEYDACMAMVPGGEVVDLRVNTTLEDVKVELAYVPLHIVNYTYKEKRYRALVNGVTAKVDGEWPVSFPRLAAVAGALLAVPAAIFWLLRRRRR